MTNKDIAWLTSKETQKHLKISGCELMHLRVSGKLTFKKKGNAYLYQISQEGQSKVEKAPQNK
jgi:hypothetical protein